MENLIKKACNELGGQRQLAEKCNVTRQAVAKWIERNKVPAERVIAVERATKKKITRRQLRPDIYPD